MGDARETEKAPDAFRTISEVADDLDLPQHVLRFWETRFPQIRPVKRAGGRRFYRPEDVDLLRGIRHLLYTDGFTIKGAQRVLKDQGVRYVQDLGIEREVAVMRSARPERGEEGEGVTFGGLLGLLPRRRPKGRAGQGDDADLPDLPEAAELPLPFPDPEADRDLAHEPDVPPMALRAPAPSAAAPRAPAPSAPVPSGRGRQATAERRDPVFEPAPDRRREPRFGEPQPEGRAFDDPEAPAFEAPRHRDARPGEPRTREPRFDDFAGRDDDVHAHPSRNARTGDARDTRHRTEPAFRPAAPDDAAGYDDAADDAGRDHFPRDHFPRDDFPRDDFGRPDAARREFARQDHPPQDGAPQVDAPQDRARRDRPDSRLQAAPRDDFGFPDIEPPRSAPRDRAPREPAPDAWRQDSLRHGREIQSRAFQDPTHEDPGHQDLTHQDPAHPGLSHQAAGQRVPDQRSRAPGIGRDEPAAPYPAEPHLRAPYPPDAPGRGRGGFDAAPSPSPGEAPWPAEPYEQRPEEPRPARRERVEPVLAPRRPTRGPASRLESLGSRPGEGPPPGGHGALDDPLLPFFEDTPGAAPSVSEPIEARIQRLRAQERRPARPYDDGHETLGPDTAGPDTFGPDASRPDAFGPAAAPAAHVPPPGPPEEFIPPRARRQADAAVAQPLPPQAAMAPRPPRREAPERLIQDGEWRQTDWVDTAWQDDPFAPPPARGPGESRAGADPRAAAAPHLAPPYLATPGRPAPPPPADDDPEIAMMEQERRRPPVSLPQDEWREPAAGARPAPPPTGPARRGAGDEAYPPEAYARPPHSTHPADPSAAYGSDPQPAPRGRAFAAPGQMAAGGSGMEQEARRVWDEGWGENAPQALPRATRVGPLIGPILEEEPASPHDVMPEDEQRRMADRMAGRPVAEPPAQRRAPPWVRSEPQAEHAPVRAEAHVAEPAQRQQREPMSRETMSRETLSRESLPREPLRPGPPEQYLPPHLRSEPRASGQPPMAAPVLSRDDVHRMQSALYELGECRRLMEGVLAGKDARTAD